MVIPQIDVPALRALRLVDAKTGGYHHRQRMCRPPGLGGWGCSPNSGGLRTPAEKCQPSGLNPNSRISTGDLLPGRISAGDPLRGRISAGDPLLSGTKPGGLV
jgi:hypothetical protein